MTDVTYTTTVADVTPEQLDGFFVGWPNPPSRETHLRLLNTSDFRVLAIADERVVGFITAISDGVLSAFIPLLEVLPAYKGRSIGSSLVARMLEELGDLYMIDLLCDDDVVPFYERIGGLARSGGFSHRNYAAQSGAVAR